LERGDPVTGTSETLSITQLGTDDADVVLVHEPLLEVGAEVMVYLAAS
jgi:hypothetical protein